jgi:hypothetical protein
MTRPPRSARSKPRYMIPKWLATGCWGWFFNLPTWARRAGCPIANEPLGTDYDAAKQRVESILLPALDAWRTGMAERGQDIAVELVHI